MVRKVIRKSSFLKLLESFVTLQEFDDCYLGIQKCKALSDARPRTCPKLHSYDVQLLLTSVSPSLRPETLWIFEDLFVEEAGSEDVVESGSLVDGDICEHDISEGDSI